jgi:NAD(P)-dependent dehydrogenase (short-subunit alcohol dehydrogenase family)
MSTKNTNKEPSDLDPRDQGPRPPFPAEPQPYPSQERKLEPRPDYGLDTYRGQGRLRDRVALITGGDSGIGRAVALAYAREGADIALSYLPEEQADADEISQAIEDAGRRVLLVPGDLWDVEYCANLVKRVLAEFGRIDILVNNAAFQGEAVDDLGAFDVERVERTLRVNLLAPFLLTRDVTPHMPEGGSVINVASIQAYDPSPAIADYATTKGGMVTLTKALAQSLIDRGIRVNCVAPGPVWTPLIAQSFKGEKLSGFGGDSPMKRPAQPKELAPAFVFLASEEGSYINGEILGVTGGRALG